MTIMKHWKTALASLLLLASGAGQAQAKQYYFSPSEIDGLKRTVGSASLNPGDEVILKDGVYRLGDFDFFAEGTAADTITLRAENPGKAIVSGPVKMRICGSYLKIDGLFFNKAWASGFSMIEFRKDKGQNASHCRLTNCVIDDCNDPDKSEKPAPAGQQPKSVSEYWVGLFGENHRVDHCYFANKRIGGLVLQLWLDENSHLNNHQIDHNLFGVRKPYGGNGAEIIRVGHSWSSQLESHAIIENNVFLHCDGENEIISVKSCNNVLRRNLFFESRGALVCRHGHYNVIEGNTFVGNNISGTCGIRIINQGHTVYDNLLCRLDGWGLLVRVGVFERPTPETDLKAEPLTSYHRAENVDIACNDFIDCRVMEFGSGRGEKMPRNVRFARNNIYGATDNMKIVRPEETLPGFYFLDNNYGYADGSALSLKGFNASSPAVDYASVEQERVMKSLSDIGASWYANNADDLTYIGKKYASDQASL